MEFYKHGKKWYREGWIDFGKHFGLGVSIYHSGNVWSIDVTIPLVHFYTTFYHFKKKS